MRPGRSPLSAGHGRLPSILLPSTCLLGLLLVLPVPQLRAGVTESATLPGTSGLAVEGSDHARVRLPAGVPVAEYADAGYTLRIETGDDGVAEAVIDVDLAPLGSEAPFAAPAAAEAADTGKGETAGKDEPHGKVDRLARQLTTGAGDRYEAVSAILGWMVHHVSAAEAGAPPLLGNAMQSGRAMQPGSTTSAGEAAPFGRSSGKAASAVGGSMAAGSAAQAKPAAAGASPPSTVGSVAARPAPAPAAAGEGSAKDAADQGPEAVLERGSGSDGGVARLAVALLGAVGIDARTVHGEVVGPPEIGSPHGPHTWIEVRFPRLGWVPSDPLYFHHYVPATYVRFAAPAVAGEPGSGAAGAGAEKGAAASGGPPPASAAPGAVALQLVGRRDRRQTVDLYPPGGPGVTARKNDAQQRAGVLRVVVSGAGRGSAVLEGGDGRRSRILVAGESVFVGLQGGVYRLEVYLEGRPPIVRQLEVGPRERRAVFLREDDRPPSGQGAQVLPRSGSGRAARERR